RRSLRPSPYTSAVSTKLTPASIAACSARSDSSSSTAPHDPPMAHATKPIVDTRKPVRPSSRYSIPCDRIPRHEQNVYSRSRGGGGVRDGRRAVGQHHRGHDQGPPAAQHRAGHHHRPHFGYRDRSEESQ